MYAVPTNLAVHWTVASSNAPTAGQPWPQRTGGSPSQILISRSTSVWYAARSSIATSVWVTPHTMLTPAAARTARPATSSARLLSTMIQLAGAQPYRQMNHQANSSGSVATSVDSLIVTCRGSCGRGQQESGGA